MGRGRDWSGVLVLVIVGGLLFYADPLGIKDSVLQVVDTVFGPYKQLIMLVIIFAVFFGILLYLLKRLIRP